MTADKNPSAKSKQNSASRNLWFTARGVVLACAVICVTVTLTPGVDLKWSTQRSLQQTGGPGQHTVYVARSATGYESGPLDNRRCTLVVWTSVQTREKDVDSVNCSGPGNSKTMSVVGGPNSRKVLERLPPSPEYGDKPRAISAPVSSTNVGDGVSCAIRRGDWL
eukprot:COSAG05_NODE_5841_length_1075_cov_2.259221_1_plen_165_part_00